MTNDIEEKKTYHWMLKGMKRMDVEEINIAEVFFFLLEVVLLVEVHAQNHYHSFLIDPCWLKDNKKRKW